MACLKDGKKISLPKDHVILTLWPLEKMESCFVVGMMVFLWIGTLRTSALLNPSTADNRQTSLGTGFCDSERVNT